MNRFHIRQKAGHTHIAKVRKLGYTTKETLRLLYIFLEMRDYKLKDKYYR